MTDMIQFNVGDSDVVFDSVKARGRNVVFELIVESWRKYYIYINVMSCLYIGMSLTRFREWRFVRIINFFIIYFFFFFFFFF